VTRPEKRDVASHAQARGASIIAARPSTVSESLLAGIDRVGDDDIVVFGFPDTIWEPVDGFAHLVDALGDADAALGIFRAAEPARSDTVGIAGARVEWVEVKPERPRSDLVWGCAAVRASALRDVAAEPEPGVYFDGLASRGRVAAVRLVDPFIDIGTPEALAEVTAEA
jgi:NDP-sugar pyrophosphorylase family protein